MNAKKPLTSDEISAIMNDFDPIDWVQVDLLAKMPIEKRFLPGLNAQEFSMQLCAGHFAGNSLNCQCWKSI
jgi:hypothetical protein